MSGRPLSLCENFLAARSDQTSSFDGINPCGGDNAIPTHESPIVNFVSINAKSNSYARAAGASSSESKKVKAKFCSLVSKNVCDGVELTIPRKVLETGRGSFARCMIEVNVDNVLKESITIGIPLFNGSGFYKEMVRVKYEWKPPCCVQCKIFGYVYDQCLKNATVVPTIEKMNNDGFQMMVNKRSGKTGPINNYRSGVNVDKTTWQPIKPKPAKAVDIPSSSSAKKGGPQISTSSSNIPTSNPYDLLSQEFDPENYSPRPRIIVQ
ncbi:hypothetical protein Tco_1415421 [Tanacetum coccineum]